jgi:hypothetical protein
VFGHSKWHKNILYRKDSSKWSMCNVCIKCLLMYLWYDTHAYKDSSERSMCKMWIKYLLVYMWHDTDAYMTSKIRSIIVERKERKLDFSSAFESICLGDYLFFNLTTFSLIQKKIFDCVL